MYNLYSQCLATLEDSNFLSQKYRVEQECNRTRDSFHIKYVYVDSRDFVKPYISYTVEINVDGEDYGPETNYFFVGHFSARLIKPSLYIKRRNKDGFISTDLVKCNMTRRIHVASEEKESLSDCVEKLQDFFIYNLEYVKKSLDREKNEEKTEKQPKTLPSKILNVSTILDLLQNLKNGRTISQNALKGILKERGLDPIELLAEIGDLIEDLELLEIDVESLRHPRRKRKFIEENEEEEIDWED